DVDPIPMARVSLSLGQLYESLGAALHNASSPDKAKDRDAFRAKALSWYERNLTLYERIDGPNHTGFAVGLANIADLYRRCRRRSEALAALRRAVPIAERTYGPEHVTTKKMAEALSRLEESGNV